MGIADLKRGFDGFGVGHGVVLAAVLGLLAGVGAFTFLYAGGPAYLSNDPAVCKQCHIMNEQFDSWRKGPHHANATCNDCHVPADFFGKYFAKGMNGYHHSLGFTMQPTRPDAPGETPFFREPIQIKAMNSQILQANCLRCHGEVVHEIVRGSTWADGAIRCTQCHAGVGHGARR